MKIILKEQMNIEGVYDKLLEAYLPYTVTLKKNPIGRWQYIEVKKNAWVGVWIRYKEKSNSLRIYSVVPSMLARVLLGGLLMVTINYFATRNLIKDVSDKLKEL